MLKCLRSDAISHGLLATKQTFAYGITIYTISLTQIQEKSLKVNTGCDLTTSMSALVCPTSMSALVCLTSMSALGVVVVTRLIIFI